MFYDWMENVWTARFTSPNQQDDKGGVIMHPLN